MGVAYDVFDDSNKRLSKKDKQRASAYDKLVQEAEQILMSDNELTKDMEDKIREESKWYNREILHIN